MSISPPSDIILDVARAADPAKLCAATARLDAAPADGAFDAALANAAPPATLPAPANAAPTAGSGATMAGAVPASYRAFEAMVLSQLFQTMMPQDSTMFGEGTSGEVWSGMFVQDVGKAVADHGGIGIAQWLMRDANLNPAAAQGASLPSLPSFLSTVAGDGATAALGDDNPWSG